MKVTEIVRGTNDRVVVETISRFLWLFPITSYWLGEKRIDGTYIWYIWLDQRKFARAKASVERFLNRAVNT